MSTRMWCNECQDWIIVVDGVAIYNRGYWWCAKHVKIAEWVDGIPYVDFPSPGKLIPGTILHCEKTNASNNS